VATSTAQPNNSYSTTSKPGPVHQATSSLHIHQEIDIAPQAGITPNDRSEYPHVPSTVSRGDHQYVTAPRPQIVQGHVIPSEGSIRDLGTRQSREPAAEDPFPLTQET